MAIYLDKTLQDQLLVDARAGQLEVMYTIIGINPYATVDNKFVKRMDDVIALKLHNRKVGHDTYVERTEVSTVEDLRKAGLRPEFTMLGVAHTHPFAPPADHTFFSQRDIDFFEPVQNDMPERIAVVASPTGIGVFRVNNKQPVRLDFLTCRLAQDYPQLERLNEIGVKNVRRRG